MSDIVDISTLSLFRIEQRRNPESEWELKTQHPAESVMTLEIARLRDKYAQEGYQYRLIQNYETRKQDRAIRQKFVVIGEKVLDSDNTSEIGSVLFETRNPSA